LEIKITTSQIPVLIRKGTRETLGVIADLKKYADKFDINHESKGGQHDSL
jgi:hypothetical protein